MGKLTYLLDTNIVSEVIKKNPDPNVLYMLARHEAQCAISVTTLNELLVGAQKREAGYQKDMLFKWIIDAVQGTFPILDYDTHCAWIQSDIVARLNSKGTSIDFKDTQIASIAISNNLILVTRNKKHFLPIQEVSNVLFVENWFEED